MEDFVKENECADISGWLKRWNEKVSYIFRVFKGYKDRRYNKEEVIHSGCLHRDQMSVSFRDACMFDIRDNLILEDQLKQFEEGSYSRE